MAFCAPKVAVALLLIRLMGPGHRRKWFLYVITGIMMIAGALSAIFLFVQCRPVAALWNPVIEATASCWDPNVLVDYTYFVGGWSFPCSNPHAIF